MIEYELQMWRNKTTNEQQTKIKIMMISGAKH
jgi:hypothetical protein